MEIDTLELSYKYGLFKTRIFTAHDEASIVAYRASYKSLWSNDLCIYDGSGNLHYTFKSNAFKTNAEIIKHNGIDLYRVGRLQSKLGLNNYMEIDSSEFGPLRVKTKIMMNKFWICNEQEEELAMLVRKMKAMKYVYGIAIKQEIDPAFVMGVAIHIHRKTQS